MDRPPESRRWSHPPTRASMWRSSRRATGRHDCPVVDDGEIEARVRAAAEETGLPFEVVPCDPALADTAQFCEAYGYALEDSANCVVVVGKSDPPVYATCVVLATTR